MYLEKEIEELEAVCNEENLNELINKKESLVKLRAKELEASKIRSRVTWLKDGEKPSKFLTSLENKGYIDKTIKRLQKQDGQFISNQKDILKEVKNFYKRLFSQTKNDCEPQLNVILKKLNTVKLTEDETGSLENELSIEEIGEALKLMKNGKSPGIDGFPAEFLKIFWKKIKFFVLKAYKYAYNKGEMSTSLRHCLITCIPKGNKPRSHLKNWRPISLLSCVYKIISSAVANRLKKVLDKLISKTQTGFVSGRYIGENIRLIYDLLHYTEKENIPGLIMLVDFEKAFDSVSWSFIYRVLDFLNFGNNFKKWIKLFNTNIVASVNQCGFLSESFPIERGCRQGDPISPYLFILCAQILYLMIMEEKKIKGITIGKNEIKITQFPNDTTIILDGTKDSLQLTLNVLEIFGNISGLKINTEKTQIVWIGKNRGSKVKLKVDKDLRWGCENFSLLGINLAVNLQQIPSLNYDPILISIQSSLSQWQRHSLTLIGKIAVLKSLIMSKLNYLFLCIPDPSARFIKKMEQLFFEFIWDNKPDKIKRNTLCMDYNSGGLKCSTLKHRYQHSN